LIEDLNTPGTPERVDVLREITVGSDLAEEPESPRFVGALAALAAECQGSSG
jgi:hypothetical protein